MYGAHEAPAIRAAHPLLHSICTTTHLFALHLKNVFVTYLEARIVEKLMLVHLCLNDKYRDLSLAFTFQ